MIHRTDDRLEDALGNIFVHGEDNDSIAREFGRDGRAETRTSVRAGGRGVDRGSRLTGGETNRRRTLGVSVVNIHKGRHSIHLQDKVNNSGDDRRQRRRRRR